MFRKTRRAMHKYRPFVQVLLIVGALFFLRNICLTYGPGEPADQTIEQAAGSLPVGQKLPGNPVVITLQNIQHAFAYNPQGVLGEMSPLVLVLIVISAIETISSKSGAITLEELKELSKQAAEAGLLAEEVNEPAKKRRVLNWIPLIDTHSNMALAGFRQDIEIRLRKLLQVTGNYDHKMSPTEDIARPLLTRCVEAGLLSRNQKKAYNTLINDLNPAVHGKEIDSKVLLWMKAAGPGFIYALDDRIEMVEQQGRTDLLIKTK